MALFHIKILATETSIQSPKFTTFYVNCSCVIQIQVKIQLTEYKKINKRNADCLNKWFSNFIFQKCYFSNECQGVSPGKLKITGSFPNSAIKINSEVRGPPVLL